eukprot:scaffold100450_cov36-Phaeocystis_antarctica.AAC.1
MAQDCARSCSGRTRTPLWQLEEDLDSAARTRYQVVEVLHFMGGEIAAAGWAKSINPLLRHEVEGVHRLGSLGYQTGPSEPQ